MAAAAKGKGEPPPALLYAWQCRRWSALPKDGGLRDQPARLMRDMATGLNVYDAMRSFWRGMKGNIVNWQQANPDESKIVGLVMRLEKEYGR